MMNTNSLDSLNVDGLEVNDFNTYLPFKEISNCAYYADIIEYIAGFISKRMMRLINCNICAKSLTSANIASALLIRKNRGGLCKPSSDVVKICIMAKSVIKTMSNFSEANIINEMIMLCLRKINLNKIFTELTEHSMEQDPLQGHNLQLVKLILKNYLTIRLHHINNTSNEVESRIRSTLTKIIHFKHQ